VLERVEEEDERAILWHLVELHFTYTGSKVARRILRAFDLSVRQFVRVMPMEYKRVLAEKGPSVTVRAAG
jgi:glutamate synthase domain-containing protein 3